MNYPFLQYGDVLPTVAVLQKLLNRTGAGLRVDGHYGPKTWKAIASIQREKGYRVSGQVNHRTWQYLLSGEDLPILDVVDVFDTAGEESDIAKVGGTVIEVPGSSNAISDTVDSILSMGFNVFLLRIHGHGAPGIAGLGVGTGTLDPGLESGSDISYGNYSKVQELMWRLQPLFGPYGCIQLMHCRTGRGKNGRNLLESMSDDIGVPVTAAINDQYGGGLDTFRFEGPTRTCVPFRANLASWAKGLPDFVSRTLP
jgi:hypothetical protein